MIRDRKTESSNYRRGDRFFSGLLNPFLFFGDYRQLRFFLGEQTSN
jgi:hypothetical protein